MHDKNAKGKAADFLAGLQAHLNSNLPLHAVKDWIHEKGKAANEGLFLEELGRACAASNSQVFAAEPCPSGTGLVR
jgi:hypothetical protein